MIICMKIQLAPAEITRFQTLMGVLSNNIDASDLVNEYIASDSNLLLQKQLRHPVSDALVVEKIIRNLSLDRRNPQSRVIINEHVTPAVKKLSVSDYINNPFFTTVLGQKSQFGDWNFSVEQYQPYELFVCNDLVSSEATKYREQLSLGYFDETFTYLSISQANSNWMSITPNEINTMKKHIDSASGNVLVFGLGLGYYPFMISMKPSVSQVVVVEKDANLIKFFQDVLLPQFPYGSKIRIVESDVFVFLQEAQLSYYDYLFIDLWRTSEDGLPLYLRIKSMLKQLHPIHTSFWIEESLIAMLRRVMLTVISEVLDGATEHNFNTSYSPIDSIINAIYHHHKGITIDSFRKLMEMISDEYLKEMEVTL